MICNNFSICVYVYTFPKYIQLQSPTRALSILMILFWKYDKCTHKSKKQRYQSEANT